MFAPKNWAAISILALGCSLAPDPASAAEEGADLMAYEWTHDGMFGSFDRAAAQRGLQVFREVCSACHSLNYVAFRHLEQLGFSPEQVDSLAAEYDVTDGPDDNGEMFERPGKDSDSWPAPYPNEPAARVANSGALPPDLSLITKARANGDDYLYSLLLGYHEPPQDFTVSDGMYYNTYFPGHQIGMPPPLSEGLVTYSDGTEATPERMAADVTTFLSWAAEPTLEERKQTGLKVMIFLIVMTGLFYAKKRRVWADLH